MRATTRGFAAFTGGASGCRTGRARPGFTILVLCLAVAGCSGPDPEPSNPSGPPRYSRALVPLHGSGELAVLSLETGEISALETPAAWPQAVAIRADLARAVVLSGYEHEALEYGLTGSAIAATGASSAVIATPYVAAYGGTTAAVVSMGGPSLALWTPPADAVRVDLPAGTELWDVDGNADGTRFFLADYVGGGSIFVLDGTGTVLDRFVLANDLPPTNTTSAGPNALAVSPDGTRLYVANFETHYAEVGDDLMVFEVSGGGQLTYLKRVLLHDAVEPTLVARLMDAHGLVVSPDGNQVLIAYDWGDGSPTVAGGIASYDVGSDEVRVIPFGAGAHPCEIAVDWGRGKAYAPAYDYFASQGGDEIWVVDLATRTTSTIDLPPNSMPSDFAVF